jgi:hypothetical protein
LRVIDLLPTSTTLLEQRLQRGAELLFDMEQRGDLGEEYDRYFRHFEHLLAEYEEAVSG